MPLAARCGENRSTRAAVPTGARRPVASAAIGRGLSARGSHVNPAFQCQYQSPRCLLKGTFTCKPTEPNPNPGSVCGPSRFSSSLRPVGTTRLIRGAQAGRPGPSSHTRKR